MSRSLRGPTAVIVALLLSLFVAPQLRAAPADPAPAPEPEPAPAPAPEPEPAPAPAPAPLPEPAPAPAAPAPAPAPAPADPDAGYNAHCARVPADCGALEGIVRLVETAPDPHVRAGALRELARRGSPDAVPLALGLARLDPDPAVRLTAVLVLAPKIGDDTVARAVGRVAANDADPSVGAAARAALAATAAVVPPTPGAAKRWRKADPAAARVIYTPTAFTLPKRTWTATSYDIGHWSLAVGVHDYVELTLQTSVPVMFVHLGPGVKVSYPVSDLVRIGAWLNTQFLIPYIEDVNEAFVIAVGGGPLLSVGNEDMAFNAGVMSYGLWLGKDFHSVYVIDPTIGGSVRVSKRVKLNLEVHVPLLGAEDDFWDDQAGKIWALLYGVRIFGDRIYGDIAFVWPIFEHCWDIMKYVPTGFPLLAFGFSW